MLDLIIRNARIVGQKEVLDIGCLDGQIAERAYNLDAPTREEIDAGGHLVSPPFVDSHFHMDSTLTYGQPRYNESGTLYEGISLWGEIKPGLTIEDVERRALLLCRWAIARGSLAIRSHVDIGDPALTAVHALLEVRKKVSPWLDLQLVAFPQDGYFRDPNAEALLAKALELGVDVVGGIPHFERTYDDGRRSVEALCRIAAERGLMVDMHCDESDDPGSHHIETLISMTAELGMQGRVTGSHLTSMHSMDNTLADKLLGLMRENDVNAIACPLINITLQGRKDTYPKRRGLTRIKEMMQRGINYSMAHDCVMDPWYAGGSHDMLEVAHMGLHVAQMTGTEETADVFNAITINPAQTLQLQGYGLEVGCNADMVVLQAKDPTEAIRLRAARLFVIRRGSVVSRTSPIVSEVSFMGEDALTSFSVSELH
ncbi:MAG TPA: cytosine deaminase [Gammaproteobacteria bacterium]|nr:cytosine deaminase [Gammaproteobacteria bacterium]|tara:strand:+ start:49 stop:1332 length:1284 start_codon:yes stop_codon:yes gene_type:complete